MKQLDTNVLYVHMESEVILIIYFVEERYCF